ncbi:MAG: TIGR02530 family flagellar biosynthesis protein [Leptolinea sp.]
MTDAIRVNPVQTQHTASSGQAQSRPQAGSSFGETLAQVEGLRFSNHAQKRLDDRSISMPENGMQRLSQAVEKAKARGGKESLILMDDLAFIVNVKDRVVVTTMDAKQRGEGVFTQIDSVVFADKAAGFPKTADNQ